MQVPAIGHTRGIMRAVTKPADENLPDEYAELITNAAAGDAPALERLLMKAQEVAYRFSYTVCGGPSDAEDVMQDALVKTFRYVNRIRNPHAFRTWLYRTVRTACLMKRRRRSGEPRHIVSLDSVLPGDGNAGALDVAQHGHSPETLAANSALRRRLTKALHALPPSYRVIVFLREMEGLTTKEAAVVLRTSESNVKMRLHRARLFLRKQLEEQ
jgi:RNA polymerase sigma-70 factor (ECF subfamily)